MPEISIKEQNTEALARVAKQQRKLQKREQVLAFAKDTLGLDKKRAKALRKLGSGYFKLDDDGLKFRGAGDKLVAVDSNQCKEFFAKKFDFLLSPQETTLEPGAIDPALLASARAGNLTAKGRVLIALNGDEAALAAALADKGNGNDKIANGHDKAVPLDKSTNPFVGLRDKSGKIDPVKMKKVESFIKAAGTRAASAVAKSAGLRLDGSPIPEKYL